VEVEVEEQQPQQGEEEQEEGLQGGRYAAHARQTRQR
jgi:hypothetical protein